MSTGWHQIQKSDLMTEKSLTTGQNSTSSKLDRIPSSIRNPKIYFNILDCVEQNCKMPEGLSPQDTYFVRKNLLTWGFIKRLDTGTYEITEDGRKFKSKVKTKRVGDSVPVAYDCVLKMTIPILRTNGIVPQNHSLGFLWWLKKYKDLDFLNPSITGPTNKSNLIIDIPRFTIPEDEELEFIVNKIKEYAKEFYLVKNIMELDTIHARVSSIKIGIHDEKFTQSVENKKIEGVQRRIYLGRDRSKILPEDKSETAYVEAPCTTPLKWTIHSNDGEYLDNYMLMPERLKIWRTL